jgi:hypothetical protein
LARRLLLGLAAVAALVAPSAFAAPIKDPHGIACPAGPSGWTNPPGDATATAGGGGRTIVAPGDVVIEGERPQGGDIVNVSCDYYKGDRHMVVDLLYALPTDPNPVSDFYFGCRSQGTKWNNEDRVFRLSDTKQWAAVAFYDLLGQLEAGDVAGFEAVARQFLNNSSGYAHQCSLAIEPTRVLTHFRFAFTSGAGKGAGEFAIDGAVKERPIVSVNSRQISLNVKVQGKRHPISIKVNRGFLFTPGQSLQVRLGVVVTKSKVPSCRAGSTGTLTVSTKPSVLLRVCSQSFLQGPARATIITY